VLLRVLGSANFVGYLHIDTEVATPLIARRACVVCPAQLVRELNVPDNWEKEHEDEDHVAWLTHETVQVRVQMCRQKMSMCRRWPHSLCTLGPQEPFVLTCAVEWVWAPLYMAELSVKVTAFGPKVAPDV
jgi:hypothetical protein